jgi:hypothetical protein
MVTSTREEREEECGRRNEEYRSSRGVRFQVSGKRNIVAET